MPLPRTRSRLPGFAASVLAQPLTQETDEIVAGTDAKAPPEPACALAGAPRPAMHAATTTTRLSATSSPVSRSSPRERPGEDDPAIYCAGPYRKRGSRSRAIALQTR